MVGLIISIILFNFIAFKTNKRLTKTQILQIWTYTVALLTIFDTYIDIKLEGYWYFTKGIDWESLLNLILLLPPVNMMFLNWYPFGGSWLKKVLYFISWEICMLTYELITLLPKPFGFFHYGWWNLGYSALLDPILLASLIAFYKLILKMEKMED